MIVGHETVVTALEHSLPPVTLLLGPGSVGKTTVAFHLARYHGCFLVPVTALSAANAREVETIAQRVPMAGMTNCFIINLDGATDTAQNILLKLLEEPPPKAKFILTASRSPLPTVSSRAEVHLMSRLTDGQVAEVLISACGASPEDAARAAQLGRGQVTPAMSALSDKDGARTRSVVAAALKAAQTGGITLELALRTWSPEHTEVLTRWAEEAAAERWVRFDPAFAPGVSVTQARSVLYTLCSYETARNAAAVALNSAFAEGR